jgi:hypothetical protein
MLIESSQFMAMVSDQSRGQWDIWSEHEAQKHIGFWHAAQPTVLRIIISQK